ncbi:MAG TPA: GNAT family N-acetyltransferase [Porticoccus sp.]|nr:GNAT family N-acetyltransferase [Porticoccus sp.]
MISFRAAKREDCRTIAELYSISSDGVADYIWAKLIKPGEEILDVGEWRYEREDSVFSYTNCTIVEVGGEIAGMMVAFPMKASGEVDEDPVLAPYSRLEEDNSYYICGMALFPEHRGKGIGHQFMALANQQAKLRRFNKISLIVFEQNTSAKRLYEEQGFKEVRRETIVAHPLIPHTGDVILMVKTLEE